eukprot:TRINITY_DN5745_c0_g1_i6.p1 TRINITY_DN5745_c0_g1~~TRINITY_DN5745_c0_g1_i6.p1  ORF type:complete len:275 (-),score=44.06 TRINITY_DN5745_c0_g1_i6:273-1097(-)
MLLTMYMYVGFIQYIQEDFYKELPKNLPDRDDYIKNFNFDDPIATDWDYLNRALDQLIERKPFNIPSYNIQKEDREIATVRLQPENIIIVEGPHILWDDRTRSKCDMKLFLDTDDDTRLSRRVYEDTVHRGKSVEEVLIKYQRYVKPCYDKYCLPSKKYADIILPNFGGGFNVNFKEEDVEQNNAVDLLVRFIKDKVDRVQAYRKICSNNISPESRENELEGTAQGWQNLGILVCHQFAFLCTQTSEPFVEFDIQNKHIARAAQPFVEESLSVG